MLKRPVIIALVVIAASVAVGLVPSLLQLVAERELIKLKERGIRVQVQGIAGFLLGLSATSAEGWAEIPIRSGAIRSFPLQLSVENLIASVRPKLNPFRTSVELSAAAYSGTLGASLSNLSGIPRITATIKGVEIGLHPQLRALGVERGQLDLAVAEHPLQPVWEEEAAYALEIKNVDLLPPSSVQQISGIARLTASRTTVQATIKKGGSLVINSGTFDSSLASGTLQGSAAIDSKGALYNINGTLRVNLDRDESPRLAAWLPLLTNQAVPSDAKNFVCNFRSTGCGTAGVIRIGSFCLRSACAG